MRLHIAQLALGAFALASASPQLRLHGRDATQTPSAMTETISTPLFATLERLARLVDVTYCIGNTGVTKPFDCISRCEDFPNLSLVTTWNTGVLMSDSCGFIAVDHGSPKESNPVYTGGPAIVVAFRGTYSITNTVVDLSTTPQKYIPYPSPDEGGENPEKPEHECTNCTVHMGFLESWETTRALIIPQLRQLRQQYPSYPIQLIGHSLGGAVACLASLELKVSLGWEDVVVTTFGEPRVGNGGFVRFVDRVFHLDDTKHVQGRTYRRVTHQDDPVPLLPLSEWGYSSHAGEIFIAKQELSPAEKDVRICNGDEDPSCIAGADDTVWDLLARMRRFIWDRGLDSDTARLEMVMGFPSRLKLWQLFFAHRDYFWRLGLCVPGGDPANWGRNPYEPPGADEL